MSWKSSFSYRPPVALDSYFQYQVAGQQRIERNGASVLLNPGEISFSFPGDQSTHHHLDVNCVLHGHFSFPGSACHLIEGDLHDWAIGVAPKLDSMGSILSLPDKLSLLHYPTAVHLLEDVENEDESYKVSGAIFRIAKFLEFLAFISQVTLTSLSHFERPSRSGANHLKIRQAIIFISDHISEAISLRDVAREVNITDDYLGKLFRQVCGMSVGSWIQRARITKARSLLMNPALSIKEVAIAVGYRDQLYFTRIFSREMTVSPRQWRLSHIPEAISSFPDHG